MGSYSSTTMWDNRLSLLSSILSILLTCPNSDTLLCYSNDPFLTVCIASTEGINLFTTCFIGSCLLEKYAYRYSSRPQNEQCVLELEHT